MTLSSSNFDFIKAQSAGQDIRFTDNDGTTLLNYYIESYDMSGQTAVLWVKVPSISASSTKTIYMYFENSSVSSTSSGSNTFTFYDGFESADTVTSGGSNIGSVTLTGLRPDSSTGQNGGAINSWQDAGIIFYNNKYYITYFGNDFNIYAITYNTTTNTFSNPVFVSDGHTASDNHHYSSMAIDSSGYFYIAYGSHATPLYFRKSVNPGDITSWSSESQIASIATYPRVKIDINNKIYVFYRSNNAVITQGSYKYITSTNDGSTWSAETTLIDNNNSDWVYVGGIELTNSNPAVIHIAFSWVISGSHSRYVSYMKSTDGGATWTKADGTSLTLPVTEANDEEIRADTDDLVYDMKLDNAGKPWILWNKWDITQTTTYAPLWLSNWSGSSWNSSEINSDIHRTGNLQIDTNNNLFVYATRISSGVTYIDKLYSDNQGSSWTKSTLESYTSNPRNDYVKTTQNYTNNESVVLWVKPLQGYGELRFYTFPERTFPQVTYKFFDSTIWTNYYTGLRPMQVSSLKAKNGTQSLFYFSPESTIYRDIFGSAQTDLSTSIWFYDDLNYNPKYSGPIIQPHDGSSGTVYIGMGGSGAGGTPLSTTVYTYRVGGTYWNTTSIARSTGWHKFEVSYTSTGFKGFIDDQQIFDSSYYTSFKKLFIVSWWTTLPMPGYFDDVVVRLYSSPEPTTSLGSTQETTAPTGSISIDSGATYGKNPFTLTLSATDNLDSSSAIQMQVSNNSDFSDANWESYVTSKSWIISGSDGTKTVYVRFKDTNNNISSTYSDSIILDSTITSMGSLLAPSNYITDTRPTFSFKKFTDTGSGINTYSVILDTGKNKSYSTSGIPASGNGSSDYVWKDDSDVKIEFLNENDSDIGNDEIHVYFKGLNNQELTEGKHSWSVTVTDGARNTTTSSSDFSIDKTSPSISELALANVSTVQSGKTYNLSILNRMPSFSGLATDTYQGSIQTNSNSTKDTFDKVSSGPQTLTLTFKKQKSDKTYTDYLTKDFSLSDIQDTIGDKKSSRFYVTTPYPLVDGYYQVQLTLKDSVGNIYNQPIFYISLNTGVFGQLQNLIDNNGNLETKITKKEEIPATTEEEKQKVKENGYIVKIKVVDADKKPVEGAKVTIHSKVQETTTNKDGIALFNSVEPGQHKVVIAYANYKGEQDVNLTEEVKEFDLDIQVKQINVFLNPYVMGVVGLMALIIFTMTILLIKNKRKE